MRLALSLILSALAVLIVPGSALAAGETRIIVKRDPGLSKSERADIRTDAGVRLVEALPLPRTEVVAVSHADAADALRDLRRDPDVAYAEPDATLHAFDDFASELWAFENTGQLVQNLESVAPYYAGPADADMDLTEARQFDGGLDGTGVTVGVVDSGVDTDHPDFAGQIAAGGHDFVDGDSDPDIDAGGPDDAGHGTHVAGTVAANDDHEGVVGGAPGAKILPVRALGLDGDGSVSDVAEGFDWAATHGAKVVVASLGGSDGALTLKAAIDAHPEVLFVVAAGNDGYSNDSKPVYPCNVAAVHGNLICVGASNQDDVPACFSNVGKVNVDVFAPGTNILSDFPGDEYYFMSGTSMATPNVASVAALVWEHEPTATASDVRQVLIDTVDHKAGMQTLSVSGGRVNALRAVGGTTPENTADGAWTGCPSDTDGDGVIDPLDACPDQRGRASDGCPDTDRDGVLDSADRCPTVAGPVNGCPRPPAPRTNTVVPDRDRDGRADPADACPTESATTSNGCPVPKLRSIKVSKRKKHKVKVRVVTDRKATVTFKLERRVCNRKGKKCRWRAAATDAIVTKGSAASFSSRTLRKGRYRIAVRVSSSAGQTKLKRKSFRI